MVNMVMAYRPPWSTVYIQLWPVAVGQLSSGEPKRADVRDRWREDCN